MSTWSLINHLITVHGFERKHAVLGVRLAKKVDSLDQLKKARRLGYECRYPFLHYNDIVQIQEAAKYVSELI